MTPLVSIVVPTRNRSSLLPRSAALLLGQEGIAPEVIYVDDGSEDETPEVLSALCEGSRGRMRAVRTEGLGPGGARNRGVAIARGAVLLFTDDDVEPPADWAAEMTRRLEDCGAWALTSRVVGAATDSPVAEYLGLRMEAYLGNGARDVRAAPMMSFAISKATFERVGGFSERKLLALEDWDLCHRLRAAGGTIRYDPAVVVRHRYAEDFPGAARRMALTGATASYLAKEWYASPPLYFAYGTCAWLVSPIAFLGRYPLRLYFIALRLETAMWLARARRFFAPKATPPN